MAASLPNNLIASFCDDEDSLFAPGSPWGFSSIPGKWDAGLGCCSVGGAFAESLEQSRVLLVATLLVNLVTAPVNIVNCNASNGVDADPGDEWSATQQQQQHWNEEDDDEYEQGNAPARSIVYHRHVGRLVPLSAYRDNRRILTSQPAALRFAFLCAYSRHASLHQLGLQLIGSLRFTLNPPSLSSDSVAPIHNLNDSDPKMESEADEFGCSLPDRLALERIGNTTCLLGQLTMTFLHHSIVETDDRTDLITGASYCLFCSIMIFHSFYSWFDLVFAT
ncbi:unnamed protein product [Protopolystoma xenopodis]|uniref:Uncharacterized protein n=1 Tax=Protopolystoma xenopodis TaxID=117903 RepID=A0A3S5B402_9PLAT|nr:unnamed protein product [Protopolystoma xenopodis]